MKKLNFKGALARTIVASSTLALCSMANAASVVTGIGLAPGGGAGGTLDSVSIDAGSRSIDLAKSFTSINPITLRFTVQHGTGPGNPYDVVELINNKSGVTWSDFHISIIEPTTVSGNGVVFPSFNQSTLSGFTLDKPPSSGPRNVNFTGLLANGAPTSAAFRLSPFDPGAGKTYTFDLVQTPTIGLTTIPIPAAGWLFGSGLIALLARAKRVRVSA